PCLFPASYLSLPPPPCSPLFPYTTLFRSAVQPEQPRLLVKLVLVATAARDLDDRGDLVGRVLPRWEIVPGVDHLVTLVSTPGTVDRKSTRLNSSHGSISYAVFCLKKKSNT